MSAITPSSTHEDVMLALVRRVAALHAISHDLALLARLTYGSQQQDTPDAVVGLLDDSDGLLAQVMAMAANEGVGQMDVLGAGCGRSSHPVRDVFVNAGLVVGAQAFRLERALSKSGHEIVGSAIADAMRESSEIAEILAVALVATQRAVNAPRIVSTTSASDEEQQQLAIIAANTVVHAHRHVREIEVALVRIRSVFTVGAAGEGVHQAYQR